MIINNKKIYFEYEVLEEYSAGLCLFGSEVKSLREGKASINEAYCIIENNELFIRNMHISEYKQSSHYNHEVLRDKKLLLNRQEINKIQKKVKEKGFTIAPIKIYTNKKGLFKIDIGLCRGKKSFDKKNSIKEKDLDRELKRNLIN